MQMSRLYHRVLDSITSQEDVPANVARLVDAAFKSSEEIEFALQHTQELTEISEFESKEDEVPGAYLQKIEVKGFRGVGAATSISFRSGPGLTLVVGRNGSGKSSLAEALEVALTGDSYRWSLRSAKTEWLQGWKNLHSGARPTITATLQVNGQADPLEIRRQWEDDANHNQSTLRVRQSKKDNPDFSEVNWKDAVTTFRPILSYNELGAQLDKGPAALFDSLDAVLGLDELTTVKDRLKDSKKKREEHGKAAKKARKAALELAEKSQDPRAEQAIRLLKGRKAYIEELEALIEGEPEDESRLVKLKAAAILKHPSAEDVLTAAERLRSALDNIEKLESTQVGADSEVAALLASAIRYIERTQTQDCPVCGRGLDPSWLEEAQTGLTALASQKQEMTTAKTAVDQATRVAQSLISQASSLPEDLDIESLTAAKAALDEWKDHPKPRELPLHLESRFDALQSSYAQVRDDAKAILQTMETEWRPVKREIARYLEAAGQALTVDEDIQVITGAENWIVNFEGLVREERFAPIADRTLEIWNLLKQQSNITLEAIKLTGKGTKRKVDMQVNVDGQEAVALGVMSQGELHSLLLSLFLPRLTLDESPFKFLVLDDPVQAMDPAKVDGLARVLEETAQTHQVIVFTHDTRLVEAVRRLRIPAHIMNVSRQKRSSVSVSVAKTPAWQFIEDAMNVSGNSSDMAPRIAQRVVPGLCRGAFEVAFKELAWELMLKNGIPHDECESRISNAKKTNDLARLAMFGEHSPNDVYEVLDRRFSKRVSGPLRLVIKHAHSPYTGDLNHLIDDTKQALREMGVV